MLEKCGCPDFNVFHLKWIIGTHGNWKNQNPWPNGLNWQCCLAYSSETASSILIFWIAMGANYSFEVKNIEIWAPTFFKQNNSSVATVCGQTKLHPCNKGAVVRQCLWGNQDPLPKHFKLTLTSMYTKSQNILKLHAILYHLHKDTVCR